MPESTIARLRWGDAPRHAGDVARAFFAQRDRDELQRDGARLREHYARLDHAQRNFKLVSRNRQYDIQERYRSTQDDFDDRGVIYVRHGDPDQRLQFNVPGIEPNESWRYQREGGDLIFHFLARQDVQDFRLVESVFDILGFANAMQARDSGDVNAFVQTEALVRSREPLSPLYSRMLSAGRGGGAAMQVQERAAGRRSIAIGTQTDSWPLRFPKALEGTLFVAAAGADSIGAEDPARLRRAGQCAHAGLDRGRLRARLPDASHRARARWHAGRDPRYAPSLPHQGRGAVRGTDARACADSRAAGRYTIRASLEHGRSGLVSRRDTVVVASPVAPRLALADLVVGSRSVRLFWIAEDGDTTWLNPLARFRRTEPIEVTLEISGLPPGTPIGRSCGSSGRAGGNAVSRLFRGSAALRVAFDGVHRGGIATVRRERLARRGGSRHAISSRSPSPPPTAPKETRRQEVTVVK